MTQEMCDKVVSKEPIMFKYCPDRCKTEEMCDKAVGFYLLALKNVPDWFLTNKMIEILDNAVFSNEYIVFCDMSTFFSNDIGLNSTNLNNIKLDNVNFDDYDHETINHVSLDIIDITNIRHVKKMNEELVSVAWHPTKLLDWFVLKDKKKAIEPFLIDKK